MHIIFKENNVFLSTPSYMFRRLLRRLEGEFYRMLKAIVKIIVDRCLCQ